MVFMQLMHTYIYNETNEINPFNTSFTRIKSTTQKTLNRKKEEYIEIYSSTLLRAKPFFPIFSLVLLNSFTLDTHYKRSETF